VTYARGDMWGEKVASGNWRSGDKELGRDTRETRGAGSRWGTQRMPEGLPEVRKNRKASGCQNFDADEDSNIVSTCPKLLNNFQIYIFDFDPLIIITFVHFPTSEELCFASTRGSMQFKFSLDFPSAFRYFTNLFLMMTWEVCRILFDVRFDLADVEGIVDKRKSPISLQVKCISNEILAP